MSTLTEKACSKCEETKPVEEFYVNKQLKSGYYTNCKSCANEAHKKYVIANKDKISEYRKEYAIINKDKIKLKSTQWYIDNKESCAIKSAEYRKNNSKYISEYQAEWRNKNKDSIVEYSKAYYLENRESIIERRAAYNTANAESNRLRVKTWRKNNPDKHNANNAKRRAAKLQRTPSWSDNWKIQQFYTMAQKLTKLYDIEFVVDHIIPLQGKLVSGLHVENNLQVITAAENSIKNNNFILGQ